jgi:hypothetical protein
VRPSALLSVLQGAGLAAGAAAALAPAGARNAVLGALQESLTGLYNDQLRAMREAGLSDEVRFRPIPCLTCSCSIAGAVFDCGGMLLTVCVEAVQ